MHRPWHASRSGTARRSRRGRPRARINVTDRLRLLARAGHDEAGRPRLEPPDGGYLVTNLELDEAMRLLGGHDRRLVTASIVALLVSILLVVVGGIGAVLSLLLAA